ncbi:MAG: hypothetical protein OXU92_08170 [Deltaproteobacteria bacterium]|nr:hypothetical protein [Deltaproteobacteria bacterium]MDD9873120.1 hypothetical protein [Deltaproteobacteria bacterium]
MHLPLRLPGAVLAALLLAGCNLSVGNTTGTGAPQGAFGDDREKVEMLSAAVGGKNVFLPGTVVLTAGTGRVLSLFNTTGEPHGFAIPALGVQEVLPAGEEFAVELPALVAGQIHEIRCHLHPPHRGAALVVLAGE